MKINFKIVAALAVVVALSTGCKKSYLDTNPTTSIGDVEMFKTTASAYTALNGVHGFLISANNFNGAHDNWGFKAQDLEGDMMGNDMVGSGSGYDWFDYAYKYVNTQSSTYRFTSQKWIFWYRIINNVNNIIENIDQADGPDDQKNDIKGQALAYRAFCYFKLATYYQQTFVGNETKPGIPIYTKGTTAQSTGHGRGTLQDNYDMIRTDIEDAIELLKNGTPHENKAHISLAAARGIAARIYSTTNEWLKARNNAILAYQDYPLMSATEYTSGFNKSSNPEWIWGSTYTSEQYESLGILDFISFMDPAAPGYASVGATRSITNKLYGQIPVGDIRKEVFKNTLGQNKFKTQDKSGFVCDYVYMRSAEMYLLQAEAMAQLNDLPGAREALEDLVTARFPGYVAPTGTKTALLEEIYLQRRIELWGEGFAREDIMRLKKPLDRPTGIGNHKQGVATVIFIAPGSPRMIFPIPQREIDINPEMSGADQNP